MNEHRLQNSWGLIAIAVAMVASAFILGGAVRNVKRSSDAITVTGSARRPIESDFVVWRGAVTGQKPTMSDAYKELESYINRVKNFLKLHGIPEQAATFSSVETEPVQEFNEKGYATGRILAYRLTQRFEISSSHVDSIETLALSATDLIREGVNITSYNPEFLYTKLGELRVEMLGEATKDALSRAKVIAENAGSRVEKIRSCRMGVFQITKRNSTEISDYGMYDTSSKEKDITAVVTVSFALQ